MAEVDFIVQALTPGNHADAVRELFKLPDINHVIVSIAYVREAGVEAVEAVIKPHARNVDFFIGIRNDTTSIQSVKRLLAMNVTLYAVDTASRHIIFHPKLYFVSNDTHAQAIIGSSNLTFNGLHNNIEVGTLIKLDLGKASDMEFAGKIKNAFTPLLESDPNHVFLIKNDHHADELFEAGRLADERIIPAPVTTSKVKKGKRDDLPPMKLHSVVRPRRKTPAPAPSEVPSPTNGSTKSPSVAASTVAYRVWKSKPLTERSLNIPSSGKANKTGSMGWGKGAFENIDHQHYFRDEVFANLEWKPAPPSKKSEFAHAKFEIVIKNVSEGVFELILSHKTGRSLATLARRNHTTELRWGSAKHLIEDKALLGRTLYLYKKDSTPPEFVIEID